MDSLARFVFRESGGSGVCRKRNVSIVDIGRAGRVDQSQTKSCYRKKWVVGIIKSGGWHRPDVRNRIRVSHILVRSRIGGLTVTSAQYCLVVPAIGNTDSW